MNRSRLAAVVSVALAASLALPACGNDTSTESSATVVASADAGGSDRAGSGSGDATTGAGKGGEGVPATTGNDTPATTAAGSFGGATPVPVPPLDRRVIVTVTLDVEVDDVGRAGVKVATMAEGVGGYVQSQQATYAGDRPSSTLVVKVPPDKVSALLAAVAGLGTVTNQTQAAEDVTAQYIDLDSRIATARASVARVREFLGRTANVSELAGLEAELTRRETELEQLVAAQQGLAARSALATVTIGLVRLSTTAGATDSEPLTPARALRAAFDTLGAIGTAVVIVVAFALPFTPFLLALVGGALVVRRRRRRRGPVAPPTVGPMSSPPPPPAAERDRVDA